MRRRSGTGGKPVKARLRGAATLKRRKGPKTVRRRSSSAARQEKEVARLTREREEALEQQTATSEILSVISRSNFKLQPVLQSVVNTAMRLCRAEQAVIYRQEQGTYRFAAGHSTVPDYLDIERGTVISPGEGTVVGRAALTKQVARIDNSWNDPLYEKKRDAKVGGVRSMIGVPLLREGETIGVIALARNRVEPFTDRETELVATFADQVVIAIENVRLFEAEQQRSRELSESLQQQTATSEVLQVISSSPGELQGVFDVILDKVVRICQADTATLFLHEKGTVRRAARHSAVSHAVMPSVPSAKSGTMRSITTKQIIHIPDYLADPAYLEGDDFVVAAAERLGIRASVHVPMLREQEVAGAVTIWRKEARAFTKKQIDLVANFAAQAVIAIENARLLAELRESLQQQTATADVLKVISRSTFDLQTVLNTLVESAGRLCAADNGVIFQRDGDLYRLAASYGFSPEVKRFAAENPLQPDRGSATGRAALEGRPIHIPDVLADPEYRATGHQGIAGYRTSLAVPFVREGTTIGAFVLTRAKMNPFTEKQIELVTTFAAQAAIAIENVRLFEAEQQRTRELTELLEQQTATSEVLQVISSSPGDLQPVFTTILENAARICEANFGNVYLWDGDAFHLVAAHNTPGAFADTRKRAPFRPNAGHPFRSLADTKQSFHVADIMTLPIYQEGDPQIAEAVELGKMRTCLGVPMLKDDKLIGAVLVFRQEVRPFTANQIALITNFAAQAVIAIENTRLLTELRESLEQQTATSDVLGVISSSPGDLAPVFTAMLENGVRICDATFGNIYSWDGELLHPLAAYNTPSALAEARKQRPLAADTDSPYGRMVSTKAIVHVHDIRTLKDYVERRPAAVAAAELGGVRTLLLVPMLKDDGLIGSFTVYRQEVRPFTHKQIELVTNFAAQGVIAIENARLLTELRTRTDELGRSVGELRALGEVSQAVNSTLDLQTVLETIVAKAVQLSNTDAGAIYVFDDMPREFHLRATYAMDQALIDALSKQHIGVDETNVTLVLAQREPTQIVDLSKEAPNEINEITLRAGYRARLTAPLFRGNEIVGLLVVRRRTPGVFPQNTVDLIKTFAAQSVLAIQNARLFENIETRTRELTKSLADLRTAQDRLVQTEKLASLGQLTAGIAHEIKNPLNFVNNFSAVSIELIDELREAFGGVHLDSKLRAEISEIADTLRDNLDKVVQHGKRANSIVKNMLPHSRQGSGDHRAVVINALVEESLNLAYHGARAEKEGFNITLERSFDPAAGEVDLFPQEITRVLLNLISNGFYAATKRKAETNGSDYEPTLTAATKNLGDKVEIRIRDNGTGISPEVKEKLFNPFFTTKPAGEGTGLGLSISHDVIVKQHGGSIEVDTQPSAFTEFRIILPRAMASAKKSGEGA